MSDRSNHRLTWIEDNGTLIKTLDVTSSEPLPCNAQTSSNTSLGGDFLVVPGLGVDHADPGPYLNGSVTVFDKSNALLSSIEVARQVHPHTHTPHVAFVSRAACAASVCLMALGLGWHYAGSSFATQARHHVCFERKRHIMMHCLSVSLFVFVC